MYLFISIKFLREHEAVLFRPIHRPVPQAVVSMERHRLGHENPRPGSPRYGFPSQHRLRCVLQKDLLAGIGHAGDPEMGYEESGTDTDPQGLWWSVVLSIIVNIVFFFVLIITVDR